jgi:hypothetical protein
MRRWGLLATAALCLALPLAADPADSERAAARAHWQALTRLDLDAAYAMLRDNHPAMAAELGDTAFMTRIEAAYADGLKRIEKVDSFYGLRATLAAFGNAAGDKHIGAGFGLMRQYTIWPQFLVRQSGRDFVVVRGPYASESAPPEGAKLISCDGAAAEAFAKARIGVFHANWSIEAQRAAEAWRLFVNDRNPFVDAPKSCRFESNGAKKDYALQWGGSSYDVVAPVIVRASAGAGAGFGVKRLANGAYWISMERMDNDAEAVVAAAAKEGDALRAAPYVVVDVRGNGGGSSSYGDRLADVLFGPAAASQSDEAGGEAWRVSPGNTAGIKAFAADARASGSNADIVAWAEQMASMLERAEKSGDRFAPALPKPLPAPPAFVDPKGGVPGKARVYLLTDYSCFSSCLLMTWSFKRRGAAQVGLPTDAATRYMENRDALLPSRLASFSTLQKVSLGAPLQIGPFEPAARYSGDISDNAAVERWIEGLAGKR